MAYLLKILANIMKRTKMLLASIIEGLLQTLISSIVPAFFVIFYYGWSWIFSSQVFHTIYKITPLQRTAHKQCSIAQVVLLEIAQDINIVWETAQCKVILHRIVSKTLDQAHFSL